mgnify:CR=1 FL=1
MKKKSSRIVALVLTLCMVFFGLPVTAMAEGRLPSADNGVIKLTEDVSVATLPLEESGETVYDLNGHNLTYTGTSTITLSDGQTLTFKDSSASGTTRGGTLTLSGITGGVKSGINPETGATVNAQNIKVVAPHCSAFFPRGDASAVNITNCDVTADVYCVGTNAATTDNYNVVITLKNSTFTATGTTYPGDDCPVMINVEGKLNVDNCIITGHRQGVMVRAGEAVIKNSSIKTLGTYSNKEQYYSSSWSSGTEVPAAALTVGNYYTAEAKAYFADANVTLINTSLTAENNFPALYMDGNTSYKTIVKLSGDSSVVSGAVMKGQQKSADAFSIEFTGGTFSTNVSDYVSNGYECKQDSQTQKWVVNEMTHGEMVVKPETSGSSTSATLDGVYIGKGTTITTEGKGDSDSSVDNTGSVEINLSTASQTSSAILTVTDVAAASLSDAPSLTVKTDAGDVTLRKDALQKVAEAGEKGNNVTVTVTKDSISASNIEAAYTVKVEANGENLLPASASDNGDITITVAKPAGAGETLEAWYAVQGADENWLPVEKLESKEVDGKLAITITHLSTVILYSTTLSSSTVATVKTGNTETAYDNFSDALDAANEAEGGSVITLWKDDELELDAPLSISKDITIISAEGKQKTITLTNNQGDRSKMIVMTDNLTLDNVALALAPTAEGNGDGIQMGNALTNHVTLTLKNGAELTFANNSEQSVQNAFVMPAGAEANVIVDHSKIIADGVDGNFSNGGIFTIQNRSEVTIKDCETYGLSVNGLTVDKSNLTIEGTVYSAIRTSSTNAAVKVVNGGKITVKNSGSGLPRTSTYGDATGVIDIGHGNEKDATVPASLTVDEKSSIVLSGNKDKEGKAADFVYLTGKASYAVSGEVTEIRQEKLPENYYSITYTVNGDTYAVIPVSPDEPAGTFITFTEPANPVVSGYTFQGWKYPDRTKVEDGEVTFPVEEGKLEYTVTANLEKKPASSPSDDTPSLGYRLPYIGESTGGKNFVSDTTGNLTVNGKYQFRITSTDGHKPVMTVSNSNFTVELASRSGNDYFYVIRCAGAAGSTANVLVDGIHVVVATVGTAGVVSDTTHPFTVAQGAAYQFKLTSASRPTFTGNNANFTIAYVSNSGNDWFFKVTAAGAAGASTTFSANGVVVTTATIA